MAYGQKNYNEIIGNSPYRINQIGCFLVAFCNLLNEHFGRNVDPLTLNSFFRDNGVYLNVGDGPGVLDGLGWNSVTAFAPDVKVGHINGPGWPPTTNAIVKFLYKSPKTGQMTTHFCLYAGDGQIVDSYDGVVRAPGYYGSPVAWASYDLIQPHPIAPIVASPPPQNSHFEVINPIELVTTKQPTHIWDLHATTWSDFKALQDLNQGDHYRAEAIYHHPLGGNYYVQANGKMDGINTIDVQPAPPPAPEVPQVKAAETVAEASTPLETAVSGTIPEDYKQSFVAHSQNFIAADSIVVTDFDGLQKDLQLVKDQRVHGAGIFIVDDIPYIRTQKMIDNNWWYGIPTTALTPDDNNVGPLVQDVKPATPLVDEDSDVNDLLDLDVIAEAKEFLHNLSTREKLVINLAKIQGFFMRTMGFLNILKKRKGK